MNTDEFWTGLFYYMALIGSLVWWASWVHTDKVKECERLNGVYVIGICFAPDIILEKENQNGHDL
jgi:hypothetical protein